MDLRQKSKRLNFFDFFKNISEQKQAEENIRRLAAVVKDSNDAVTIQDFEGRITAWNRGAELMYGYSEKEALEMNMKRLTSPDKVDEQNDFTRRLMAGERISSFETKRVTKDGRILDIWLTVTKMLDDNGHPIGIASTERDITERKRAEEIIGQKVKELQDKNDELIRFTYAVSHDLKSPLVTIRTFLGFLEKDILKPDAALVDKDLTYIRNAADKMSRLLDELLQLSRIGRKVNPPVAVTLQEVVKEALVLTAGRIVERGVAIEISEDPVQLYGDRQRLVEVFQNLVDNAIKFMGSRQAPRVEIGVKQVGGETVLFVRDNGIGIDPKYMPKIFGLFEKLDPGTDGTGVGLALVKRIVEVHGGRIWVESEGLGKGTTFLFTLSGTKRKSDY